MTSITAALRLERERHQGAVAWHEVDVASLGDIDGNRPVESEGIRLLSSDHELHDGIIAKRRPRREGRCRLALPFGRVCFVASDSLGETRR